MKKTLIPLLALFLLFEPFRTAQSASQNLSKPREALPPSAAQVLADWQPDNIDTLDMEKRPKIVTGGLFLTANVSNYIVNKNESTHRFSSNMKVGMDFGAFLDFYVVNHFAIQTQLIFTAEQNRFIDANAQSNLLWSLGLEIPVYFLGRYGNSRKGWFDFGGGPFTHFTVASNLGNYDNSGEIIEEKTENSLIEQELESFYTLHTNHSGIAATLGYEFPFGLQILLGYRVSLSDILSYYHNNEEAAVQIYPQRITLGVGYHFR